MVTLAETTSSLESRRFLRDVLRDFRAGGPGFGWADMSVNQWADATVDQWANLPVAGNSTSLDDTYTYDPAGNRVTENNGTTITTLTVVCYRTTCSVPLALRTRSFTIMEAATLTNGRIAAEKTN